MIISNFDNYTLSSYNMQQKVDITHSIRIETSYTQFKKYFFKIGEYDRLSKRENKFDFF